MVDKLLRLRTLNLVVGLAALGYIGVAAWAGWRPVLEAAAHVGQWGLLIGVFATLVNAGLRFVRWQAYLASWGHRVAWLASLRIYLAGFAFAATPGGAGEPVLRGILLKPFGISHQKTVAAYVSERISDLIAVVALTTIGLSAFHSARPLVVAVAVAIVVVLVLLANGTWLHGVNSRIRARQGRVARLAGHALDVVEHARDCFALPLLMRGLAIGLVAWLIAALGFYALVYLAGSPITLRVAVFIYAFSILAGAISFLPGGIGTAEAAMIGLLIVNGMPEPEAIAVTILSRFVTLWFSVGLGLFCYVGSATKPALEAGAISKNE